MPSKKPKSSPAARKKAEKPITRSRLATEVKYLTKKLEDASKELDALQKHLEGLRGSIPLANQTIASRQREACAKAMLYSYPSIGPDAAATVRATPLVTEG